MSAQDEMDREIAALEQSIARLRAIRAQQVVRQNTPHFLYHGVVGACLNCGRQDCPVTRGTGTCPVNLTMTTTTNPGAGAVLRFPTPHPDHCDDCPDAACMGCPHRGAA